MFICPICGIKLNIFGNKYICPKNHSFDVARQGYVNLLPVSGKKTKNPGDNEIMILARREFLNGGYFNTLKDRLKQILKENNVKILVDSGCAEGFYTKFFAKEIQKVYAALIRKGFSYSAVGDAIRKYTKEIETQEEY
jgi:23S rRNA (guanine745-N1)-methyltransferase